MPAYVYGFLPCLGTAVFLVLYFSLFWVSCRRGLLNIAAMVLMGVAFAKYNGGATTFFIFAAACGAFVVESEADGIKLLLAIEAAAGLTWWALHLNGWFLVFGCGLSFIVGASNIHFAQRNRVNKKLRKAQEEIEHLAKVAERERIARDLHDVLGHTLSVIILKSELAGKLMDRDPNRAGHEIREVEQISRQALSEVRDAIRGYRSQGLPAELARAKCTLETAGVAVTMRSSAQLRDARACTKACFRWQFGKPSPTLCVTPTPAPAACAWRNKMAPAVFEIEDDGRGGLESEGNGLRGMRERVEMLGGTLESRLPLRHKTHHHPSAQGRSHRKPRSAPIESCREGKP